jgi:predicted metal-dependent phosphoesterase TrpH
VIDLHTHTTASDGRCTPEELVQRAQAVGISTLSVTDHDTLGGVAAATAAASTCGVRVIPGIEITSVYRGKDVHVLAYFVSERTPGLLQLVESQQQQRLERALEIARRLEELGAPIDVATLRELATAPGGKAIARPQLAEMLIAAGHVSSVAEAFERFLGEASPAYVPHRGASPAEVVELVARGGAAASLAHPGYRGAGPTVPKDDLIPELVEAGLVAIEAIHSSHDAQTEAHYAAVARRHGLAVTGGSDYHGEGTRRAECFGVVHLPEAEFDDFCRRVSAGRRCGADSATPSPLGRPDS